MIKDSFGRRITYLRISVTDRCNYRCTYCMPEEGVTLKSHGEILRYEEIVSIVKVASELGISKIRLTGGEPLLKRNIETLVEEIACIPGINEVAMTTNGAMLTYEKARFLKNAGLNRVNISLDTIDPVKFKQITRNGELIYVLNGIKAAVDAGLTPVKINMVVFVGTTQKEIEDMRTFCSQKGLVLQTINHFSLKNHDSSRTYSADRPLRCALCNRLRLTADGFLKPCLFSDIEIKVDLKNIKRSFLQTVDAKPENGQSCLNRSMSQIGG